MWITSFLDFGFVVGVGAGVNRTQRPHVRKWMPDHFHRFSYRFSLCVARRVLGCSLALSKWTKGGDRVLVQPLLYLGNNSIAAFLVDGPNRFEVNCCNPCWLGRWEAVCNVALSAALALSSSESHGPTFSNGPPASRASIRSLFG